MIDDKPTTKQISHDLWNPAWKCSYLDGSDCDAEKVMTLLGVDRGPNSKDDVAAIETDVDVQSLIQVQRIQKSKFYFDGNGGH